MKWGINVIVKLIVDQAIIHKDMPIDSVYARRWINEGMTELAIKYDSACVRETEEMECTDVLDEYPLPTGAKAVRRVYREDKNEYHDFMIDMGYIKFGNKGKYNVQYLRQPVNVKTESEEPEIHPDYHLLLSLFIASRELARVNKIDPKAPQLLQEFYFKADQVNNRLSNMKRGLKISRSVNWV